jgi:hypothetical protein
MHLLGIVSNRINRKLLPEALEEFKKLPIKEGDRVRVVFEFEIVKLPTTARGGTITVKDAVEIRHRRPWD